MVREEKWYSMWKPGPVVKGPQITSGDVNYHLFLASVTLAFLGGSQDKTPITQICVIDINSNYQIGSWSN